LSTYINKSVVYVKYNMKIRVAGRGLFQIIRDCRHDSGPWSAVAAFIAGMVFTAVVAQILVFAGNNLPQVNHENIVPIPQHVPGLMSALAYTFPGEASTPVYIV
jgi:hypothetical protein